MKNQDRGEEKNLILEEIFRRDLTINRKLDKLLFLSKGMKAKQERNYKSASFLLFFLVLFD